VTDLWLVPWVGVAEVIGPKRVRLACGHERGVELETDPRVLLRATLPCLACWREGKGEGEEVAKAPAPARKVSRKAAKH
jgi:hypothetical protein